MAARILLIHLTSEFDSKSGVLLTKELEKFFSLACNLEKYTRLRYFGIVTFGSAYKILMPLQIMKGNYLKLSLILSKLRWQIEQSNHENSCNASEALPSCFSMFEKQAQMNVSKHLDLTILTMQKDIKNLKKDVLQVTKQLNCQNNQKVQLMHLHPVKLPGITDYFCNKETPKDNEEEIYEMNDLIENIDVNIDSSELHSVFMAWLKQIDIDQEFISLSFPSGLKIKCDVQERYVDPLKISFSQASDEPEQTTSASCSSFSLKNLCESPSEDNDEVRHLKVLKVLKLAGVCESLFYGKPLVLSYTACWKLDLAELGDNKHNFQALCHLLSHEEKALLVVEKGCEMNTHFVILPSCACLLLRPIVTQELLLPVLMPQPSSYLPGLPAMQSQLQQVDYLEGYNPLNFRSNLYERLHNLAYQSSLEVNSPKKVSKVVNQKNNIANEKNKLFKFRKDNSCVVFKDEKTFLMKTKNINTSNKNEENLTKSNSSNANKSNHKNCIAKNTGNCNKKRMAPLVSLKANTKRKLYTPKDVLLQFPTEL